ncbi:hypothetical protein JR316_0008620 [Psilocybe cubensis]|uniref:Uncharacterized protein n=2 Tax=Psilocybe cubensis TaxID=181762 RepID=A0ACB8GS40_PSICU|nr:hypothetical protein JR316_0008620 [Psilocybe cubensis]KAH9478167.1 hypothetical protein JR316_0008620 [Psilocybe cubensis]
MIVMSSCHQGIPPLPHESESLKQRRLKQRREKALKTYQNVSGGYARYCLSKDEAEDMYREALQSSQVVLVKTPTRETLKLSQLSGLNGFRNGDPTGPEEASWMAVLVGRNPGVYLLDDVGTVGIQENIKFIKGARAVPYRLRSEAVEAFTLALKAGVVVMVDRGRDIRLPLTLNTTSVVDGEPFVKSEVDI